MLDSVLILLHQGDYPCPGSKFICAMYDVRSSVGTLPPDTPTDVMTDITLAWRNNAYRQVSVLALCFLMKPDGIVMGMGKGL